MGAPGDAGVDCVRVRWASNWRADLADRGAASAREDGRGAGARTGAAARPKAGPNTSRRTSRGLEARRRGRARASHPRDARASRRRDRTSCASLRVGRDRARRRYGTAGAFHGTTRGGGKGVAGGRGRVQSPTHHVPFSSSRVTHFRRNDGMSPSRGTHAELSQRRARRRRSRGCESFSGRGSVRRHGRGKKRTRGATGYEGSGVQTNCFAFARTRASSPRPSFSSRTVTRTPRASLFRTRSSVRSGESPPMGTSAAPPPPPTRIFPNGSRARVGVVQATASRPATIPAEGAPLPFAAAYRGNSSS